MWRLHSLFCVKRFEWRMISNVKGRLPDSRQGVIKVPDSLQVAFRILDGNRNGNQQDYRLMFQVKKGMKE